MINYGKCYKNCPDLYTLNLGLGNKLRPLFIIIYKTLIDIRSSVPLDWIFSACLTRGFQRMWGTDPWARGQRLNARGGRRLLGAYFAFKIHTYFRKSFVRRGGFWRTSLNPTTWNLFLFYCVACPPPTFPVKKAAREEPKRQLFERHKAEK